MGSLLSNYIFQIALWVLVGFVIGIILALIISGLSSRSRSRRDRSTELRTKGITRKSSGFGETLAVERSSPSCVEKLFLTQILFLPRSMNTWPGIHAIGPPGWAFPLQPHLETRPSRCKLHRLRMPLPANLQTENRSFLLLSRHLTHLCPTPLASLFPSLL